jgi:hypothetical protein
MLVLVQQGSIVVIANTAAARSVRVMTGGHKHAVPPCAGRTRRDGAALLGPELLLQVPSGPNARRARRLLLLQLL